MKSEYAIVNHFLLDFQALGGRQFCNFSLGGRLPIIVVPRRSDSTGLLPGQLSGLSIEQGKGEGLSKVFLLLGS